jgi:hypothetical protein
VYFDRGTLRLLLALLRDSDAETGQENPLVGRPAYPHRVWQFITQQGSEK